MHFSFARPLPKRVRVILYGPDVDKENPYLKDHAMLMVKPFTEGLVLKGDANHTQVRASGSSGSIISGATIKDEDGSEITVVYGNFTAVSVMDKCQRMCVVVGSFTDSDVVAQVTKKAMKIEIGKIIRDLPPDMPMPFASVAKNGPKK